jgi:hypothetical protein
MTNTNELELVALEEDSVMPSDKPLFESRDLGSTDPNRSNPFDASEPGSAGGDAKAQKQKKYAGVERRRNNRRKQQDRRGEVRFSANSSDRRENQGRRAEDNTPKFW